MVPFVRQFIPLTVSLISCDFISDENVEEHFDEDGSGNLFLLLPYSVLYVEKLIARVENKSLFTSAFGFGE